MSWLTSGRREPCKDNIGGVKEVWLATFIPYSPTLILGYRDMVVTGFPDTQFYEFNGEEKSFNENLVDDGGYDQELTLKLIKQDYATAQQLLMVTNSLTRAVVVGYNGKAQMVGLHNGLDCEVRATDGGSKSGFNGYELTLKGMEPFQAPYLEVFPGAGTFKEGVTLGCMLASSGNPSSMLDLVSSCNAVTENTYMGLSGCMLASSSQRSSASRTISECYG